jgi:hypothetical protein
MINRGWLRNYKDSLKYNKLIINIILKGTQHLKKSSQLILEIVKGKVLINLLRVLVAEIPYLKPEIVDARS